MATFNITGYPKFQAWNNSGQELSGGYVYTYIAGTTTLQATYTDSTGNTPNSNPIVLDSRGEANIWLNSSNAYKFIITDGNTSVSSGGIIGNQLVTIDNIIGTFNPLSGGFGVGGDLQIKNYSLTDNNGNAYITFTTTPSAVNKFSYMNAATGNYPIIGGTGTDATVGINITNKNNGPTVLTNNALNEFKGSDIASASTTNIASATGNFVDITGTTTITALGTAQAGTQRILRFNGILTLTYNATSLILPTSANITTANGDIAGFVSLGSGNWKCFLYQRVDGSSIVGVTNVATGTGLTGGPITTTGTVSLANTVVTPGAYTYGSFTVDQQGRLTAASSGTTPVTSVAASTGITIGGTAQAPTVAITSTGVSAGTYTTPQVAVNAQGQLTSITAVPFPNRNRIINGSMRIWQHYAVATPTTGTITNTWAWAADRWQFQVGSATNGTASQQAGATSGSQVTRVQRNNGDTGTANITYSQSLTRDQCIGAAGNIITLSFKARKGANFSSGSNNLTVAVYSGTGTSDISNLTSTFTGANSEASTNVVLTSNFQTFTLTTGTLGSTVTQLESRFLFAGGGTAGAADYFEITDVQLEISPIATTYEGINVIADQLRCWPFRYRINTTGSSGTNLFGVGLATSGTTGRLFVQFPVPMRVTPTLTVDSTASNYAIYAAGGSFAGTVSAIAATALTLNNTQLAVTTSTGLVAGNATFLTDAGATPTFLEFNAEIA